MCTGGKIPTRSVISLRKNPPTTSSTQLATASRSRAPGAAAPAKPRTAGAAVPPHEDHPDEDPAVLAPQQPVEALLLAGRTGAGEQMDADRDEHPRGQNGHENHLAGADRLTRDHLDEQHDGN